MAADILTSTVMAHCGEQGGDTPIVKGVARPTVSEVYEAHFAFVFRCLRHLGVREASLDDAVQDVFLVVHDKLASFDGQCAVRTWLYGIVIRVARRYRERQGRATRFDTDEALAGDACPERTADAREKLDVARRALEQLDQDKREVFVLSEVEQMSAPEIATITGVPVNTVYSRLRAAKLAFESAARRLENTRRRKR